MSSNAVLFLCFSFHSFSCPKYVSVCTCHESVHLLINDNFLSPCFFQKILCFRWYFPFVTYYSHLCTFISERWADAFFRLDGQMLFSYILGSGFLLSWQFGYSEWQQFGTLDILWPATVILLFRIFLSSVNTTWLKVFRTSWNSTWKVLSVHYLVPMVPFGVSGFGADEGTA